MSSHDDTQGILKLAVAGWSASGKTHYARLLAKELDLTYIGASEILIDLIGIHGEIDWIADRDVIWESRDSFDRLVDTRIVQALEDHKRVITDSWIAPWIGGPTDLISIWFDCSLDVRVRNAIGYPSRPVSPNKVRQGLLQKDADSVQTFRAGYGIDYGPDPAVFDHIVDVDPYMGNNPNQWPHNRKLLMEQLHLLLSL